MVADMKRNNVAKDIRWLPFSVCTDKYRKLDIQKEDNFGTLYAKLKVIGADLVLKTIEDLEKGERRYILKCSGSELYFIEDLKTALLASSYNRFKRDVGNK
jgi:hypothetical protein